jgi:hypothetical protein
MDRRATQEMIGAGQNETTIAVNPLNRDNAIAVAKDFRNPPNQRNYLYTTTDGGITWLEQLFPRPNPDLPQDLDPVVFFRGDGRAYLVGTSFSDFGHGGLFAFWSDDGGYTWSPPSIITPPKGHFADKAWLAFDETGGPHNGTIYVAWTHFGDIEILASRSTDGGATWSAPVFVSNGSYANNNDGAQLVVLPDGTLLVVFLHAASPGNVGTLVLARSTDGGATFEPNVPLFPIHQPPFTLPGENWRHFTYHSLAYDPVRRWLTVIWPDYRDSSTEGINILLSRSTDLGATWTSPTRLNDDPPGIVRDQWFPALAAAPDGRLTAVWLDRREDPQNRLYYAYARTSLDGGLSWQPGVRISSAPSNPNVGSPPGAEGIGDYIGISAGPGVVWASWTDVRNGTQDIYAARDLFTPQPTPTPMPTSTRTASPTPMLTPLPTFTPVPGSTQTPTRTATTIPPVPTSTRQATPTPCAISFSDVPADAYFYEPVRYLYCRGVVSGYADGTFRPWNNTTRSQVVKIVVLAQGWQERNPPSPTFSDVPYGSTFYTFIETAFARGVIGGYECGSPEPCDPQRRPVFRPFNDVTRGQLAKIVVQAAGWPIQNPPSPTFSDVPHGSTFYTFVETAVQRGILTGYTCGSPEPCDPQRRPVFRPGNPATRGQIAKIVYNAVVGP